MSDSTVSTWFAEEVQPHERALRIFLRTRFPAHPDIDDLVQETYARILKAREQAPVRSPKAFLFVTARNAALDFFRRRKIIAIDGSTIGVTAREADAAADPASAAERVFANLAYGPHPERNRLDLYLPAEPSDRPLPLVIWVHSGGWYTGGKGGGGAARALVKRGYAVAAINYRFSQDAVFPAQIEDCQRAIRWLRAHAATYNLDSTKFGAWGGSAGGHLVALLGTAPDRFRAPLDDPHRELPASVVAVCALNPPTDMLRWDAQALPDPQVVANQPDSMVARLLGGPPDLLPDAARRASPITYVGSRSAPFFLVHGDADRAVPPQQSITFDAALRVAGVESTLHLVPGGGHANETFAQGVPREEIAAFFDRHLKPPRPATQRP